MANKRLFANDFRDNLAANILAGDLSFDLVDASPLPVLADGDYLDLVISKVGAIEIIKVTAIVGNTLTVVRAQEGTTALGFTAGDIVELAVTKAALEGYAQEGTNVTFASVIVEGDVLQVNSEITTLDAVLVLNSGEVGAGITNLWSGFQFDRGTLNDHFDIFDETTDTQRIGERYVIIEVDSTAGVSVGEIAEKSAGVMVKVKSVVDATHVRCNMVVGNPSDIIVTDTLVIAGGSTMTVAGGGLINYDFTQPIATREASPINGGLAIWNSSSNRFETTAAPVNSSAGVGDAAKPIVLDAAGLIALNMMQASLLETSGAITPVVTYGAGLVTHSAQVGKYLKRGHQVTVRMNASFDANGATGQIYIYGFPFVFDGTQELNFFGSWISVNGGRIICVGNGGTTNATLHYNLTNANAGLIGNVIAAHAAATGTTVDVFITGTYITP